MKRLLIIGFLFCALSAMATDKFYYVAANGNGNWNGSVWYTDSTHATLTSTPTSSDNVYIGNHSGTGTLTINVAASCAGFISSGFAGTLAGTLGLNVGGNLYLSAAMTITYSGGFTITQNSNIITAGKTIPCNISINGSSITVTLLDDYTSSSTSNTSILVTAGTFDLNGKNVTLTAGGFASTSANTRTITLGTGVLQIGYNASANVNASAHAFDMGTQSGLTITATTGTIRLMGVPTFRGQGKTYGRLEWRGASITQSYCPFLGANTFSDIVFEPTGTSQCGVMFLNDQTCTDTMKIYGVSRGVREFIRGKNTSDHINLAASTYLFNYVDFHNIHLTSSTYDASSLDVGNAQNNIGITFPTPITRFAVMTANRAWSTTAMWSASDGGATGASIPLPGDSVVFTAATLSSSRTLTVDVIGIPKIDFTNIDQNLTITLSVATISAYPLNCGENVVAGSGALWIIGYDKNNSYTMKTGNWDTNIDNLNATATLIKLGTGDIRHYSGTLTIAGNSSAGTLSTTANDVGTRTINLGSYIITLSGNSSCLSLGQTVTFNAEISTVLITGTPTTANRTMTMGAVRTFYNLSFSPTGTPTTYWVFNDAFNCNISNDLTLSPNARVQFKSGQTYAVTGDVIATGTATDKIYIRGSTTSAATISKESGNVCCDYLDIDYSTATGGATFKAGSHSTDGTHNSGWSFTDCAAGYRNFIIHGTTF